MRATLEAGFARLDFDGATCVLRYTTGWKGLPVTGAVGRRELPVTALAGVELEPARSFRAAKLRLLARPGADPLLAAAGDELRDSDHPYVLTGIADGDLAARYAEAIAAAIESTGLAGVPAGGFLLEEPVRPPLEAKGRHGLLGFDGDTISFTWGKAAPDELRWRQRRTIPLSAVGAVEYAHPDHHLRGGYVYLELVGAEPAVDPLKHPDAFPLDPSQAGPPLLVAAAIVAAAERLRSGSDERPPTPRRIDGVPLRPPRGSALHGLDGAAEFDGATLTITARAATRTIPLAAVDWVELSDAGTGGVGWLRVHLAGAPPDPGPFDPARDQDTVRHADDVAAVDFAHRVTTARAGLTSAPDAGLLATAGERPDIASAMLRASRPLRGLVAELRALPHRLPKGDQVQELELAVLDGQAGLLARSGRRVLFLHGDRPLLELSRRGLAATWSGPDERGLGELLLTTATAAYRLAGVWAPARLAAGLGPDDTTTGTDLAARLRRLGELRAAGLVSEAEFAAKRAALLDRL